MCLPDCDQQGPQIRRIPRLGKFEVTAVSIHAYAYLAERYQLLLQGTDFSGAVEKEIESGHPLPELPKKKEH